MASILHRGRRTRTLLPAIALVATLLATASVSAQDQRHGEQPGYASDLDTPFQGPPPADEDDTGKKKAGTVAISSVGTAGQRLEPGQGSANIKPMARLNTRIANRVQSRVRNRIDRYYDPEANATSPFKIAADQASAASPKTVR